MLNEFTSLFYRLSVGEQHICNNQYVLLTLVGLWHRVTVHGWPVCICHILSAIKSTAKPLVYAGCLSSMSGSVLGFVYRRRALLFNEAWSGNGDRHTTSRDYIDSFGVHCAPAPTHNAVEIFNLLSIRSTYDRPNRGTYVTDTIWSIANA